MSPYAKMLAAKIAPLMKQAGFRKRGMHWWIESSETFSFLNLQMSQFGPKFYLNLGVFFKGLGVIPHLNANKCHLRYRLEGLMPDRMAALDLFDFYRGGYSDEKRLSAVETAVHDYALPFLRQCATLDGVRAAIGKTPEVGNYISYRGKVFLGIKLPEDTKGEISKAMSS